MRLLSRAEEAGEMPVSRFLLCDACGFGVLPTLQAVPFTPYSILFHRQDRASVDGAIARVPSE